MRQVMVRYTAKPEAAAENQRLIEKVFAELREKSPDGVRYMALKLADGSFVHFSIMDEGAPNQLVKLDTFQAFQSGIKDRCIEPPKQSDVTIVGNYRMLEEQ
jgi:hypothetical protein